jgi:hypothetical protein
MAYRDTHKITIFDANVTNIVVSVEEHNLLVQAVHNCTTNGQGFVFTDQNDKVISIPETVVRNFAISLERV